MYIAEAHAANEWPVGDPIALGKTDITCGKVIDQPQTIEERLQTASIFRDSFGLHNIPFVVDSPKNDPVDRAFSFWPTRFYVLEQDDYGQGWNVAYRSMPDARNEYHIEEVEDYLQQLER